MLVADFDYHLPDALIAQAPPDARDDARLLTLDRTTGSVAMTSIGALPALLRPGDLIVVNDTRVFPARLIGRRDPSGGAVECLLLERLDADKWDALVHPGQKLGPGRRFVCEGPGTRLFAEVLDRRTFGRRTIRLWSDAGRRVEDAIDEIGHVPLPPYIRRPDTAADRDRYQTVFARSPGSVAAPTAGLHFTGELLERLEGAGIERVALTLHVGYGTFKPVRVERVEDHEIDPERYEISDGTADRLNHAIDERRRIVAVGTTTTRALETAAIEGSGRVRAGRGTSRLFICPGFPFQVVGGLLTNFHLPRSSLLMLVCAFAGRERVLAAYRYAVERRFRFYSYGDAMLIV